MESQNHYRTLGLELHSSDYLVREAYKKLIRTAHPDKAGD